MQELSGGLKDIVPNIQQYLSLQENSKLLPRLNKKWKEATEPELANLWREKLKAYYPQEIAHIDADVKEKNPYRKKFIECRSKQFYKYSSHYDFGEISCKKLRSKEDNIFPSQVYDHAKKNELSEIKKLLEIQNTSKENKQSLWDLLETYCDYLYFTPLTWFIYFRYQNSLDEIYSLGTQIGFTDLTWAVVCNQTEEVEKLLNASPACINKSGYAGTSLYLACKYGNLEMVRFLADKGADLNISGKFFAPNCPSSPDTYTSPLRVASRNGFPEIVEVLVEKMLEKNITQQELQKICKEPLRITSQRGHSKVVQYFVKKEIPIEYVYVDSPKIETYLKSQKNIQRFKKLINSDPSLTTTTQKIKKMLEWYAKQSVLTGHCFHHQGVAEQLNDAIKSAEKLSLDGFSTLKKQFVKENTVEKTGHFNALLRYTESLLSQKEDVASTNCKPEKPAGVGITCGGK